MKRKQSDTELESRRILLGKKQVTMIQLLNIQDEEVIHQRCLLVKGLCQQLQQHPVTLNNEFVSVSTQDEAGNTIFPEQTWPVAQGNFKALLFLNPGVNVIVFKTKHENSRTVRINYSPLTQVPPLHLAIMVAKDSPLLIDCPPAKRGGISSAHSDLDAAVAKLRMAAYMWQAMTAEDMRMKGVGRRAFRLDEEWAIDTVSQTFHHSKIDNTLYSAGSMGTTAKVHIIPTEKTVAELRDPNLAQHNPSAYRKNDLHKIFEQALQKYGGPFISSARPVVAGMILDSHYSTEQDLVLGHAAHGCHKPLGLSLGMMGSYLTYSFPRFIEEVPACLLDTTNPGDTVGNDNGECSTLWEACAVGQAAFLHEVGHAFGADHTSGIMASGLSGDWPKAFLPFVSASASRSDYPEQIVSATTVHEATWDIQEALQFSSMLHFRLPTDPIVTTAARYQEPTVSIDEDEDGDFLRLVIEHQSGIARVKFNDEPEPQITLKSPQTKVVYNFAELEQRFKQSEDLHLNVLAMNGKPRIVPNVWSLLVHRDFVRVPGTNTKIVKKGVISHSLQRALAKDTTGTKGFLKWGALLSQIDAAGKIIHANKVDLRVGCVFDGAVVYFPNGQKTPCGPRYNSNGGEFHYGGHASQMLHLPRDAEIVKVEVSCGEGLRGVRVHLSNGKAVGELNANHNSEEVVALEPPTGHRVIGFYGRHAYPWGYTQEFGIVTWPKDKDLPEAVYDIEELKNTDKGPERSSQQDEDQEDDDTEQGESDDGCSEYDEE